VSKVWFVTGSSRGLGRAFVEVALEAGDRVAATARHPERLRDLVGTYCDRVLPLRLDVTDHDAAVRAVAQTVETFGRIDVAVNSAGYSDLSSFEDTTIDSFRTQVDTNFYGVVNVSKAVVPILREQGKGHLIQVSSLSARFSAPGLTAYQAAKWAVTGFPSGLAHELAPFGVKITVLEPGGMRTDWAGSSMTSPPPSPPYQPTIGAFAEQVRSGSGHEATSARRVAEVVRDLAGRDDAPLRLLLGTDAVPLAQQAARELAASDEAWRDVSLSVSDGTQTRAVGDDAPVSVADHQTLRVLKGRYVLERAVPDVEVAGDGDGDGEVLAVVRGPDGGACMRRQDAADDAWVALWNGDAAHPPDATGMLAAIVAPLAAGNVPVWVAASYDGDLVLIPVDQVDEASELLRRAGHRVTG
jgi:NAD(P)-dependent dehydrogenase (short-subunit alcohol dehydrogenase family)